VTPTTADLPGRVIDDASDLRHWNGHLILAGHIDKQHAAELAAAYYDQRWPGWQAILDLGPAFHEHAHPGEHDWALGSPQAPGARPVTVFLPQRHSDDDCPTCDGTGGDHQVGCGNEE
jgi:hypothetical protein